MVSMIIGAKRALAPSGRCRIVEKAGYREAFAVTPKGDDSMLKAPEQYVLGRERSVRVPMKRGD